MGGAANQSIINHDAYKAYDLQTPYIRGSSWRYAMKLRMKYD